MQESRQKIAVTGGSGGCGRYVLSELSAHGYAVLNLDRSTPEQSEVPFVQVDLLDFGEVLAAISGCSAVVHLAADPHPDDDFLTGARRFKNNTLSAYNVFSAAAAAGVDRVVWSSSETIFGFPFANVAPEAFPVHDGSLLQPQNAYALSKVMCEQMAEQMHTMYGTSFLGLRLSNVLYEGTAHPANYEAIPSYWSDVQLRKFNLWDYVDARDAAVAVRLALEVDGVAVDNFLITAADTIMNRPSRALAEEAFPGVPVAEDLGEYQNLVSSRHAEQVLGYVPQYSWRDVLRMPYPSDASGEVRPA